jgi:Holliday junction resolvasome RuvABC endonuclease subunit
MVLLTLDLGTKTGFCVGARAGVLVSGSQNFKPGRYDGGGIRFVRFRKWLDELQGAYPIDRVAFEEVRRHAGTDAAHVYGGLMATLQAWCEDKGVPYEGIPVGTIKKAWTGSGNAGKDAMIAEAVRRGFAPATDDEADALAIWFTAIGGGPPVRRAEIVDLES